MRSILITLMLTVLFVWLGFSQFSMSYLRFGESAFDLWQSVKYYFCEVLRIEHTIEPTVENFSNVLEYNILLPKDFEAFLMKATAYCELFVSQENFYEYLVTVSKMLATWSQALLLILPCVLAAVMIVKKLYGSTNLNHGKDTVPLTVFKGVAKYTYHPLKRWGVSYVNFLREHFSVLVLWGLIWALHLNIASIVVEFIAYYLYFSVSLQFLTVYVQVCKLFIDLQVVIKAMPIWCLVFVGYFLFDRFRKRVGQMYLRRLEARNCGFINELPIVSMTCGSMGKKKTTVITDMALSQEVMFRQKAFELLKKNDMKFPFFPWVKFEMALRRCMEYGRIYNLATVREWVRQKEARYGKHQNAAWQLYGYDVRRYGMEYNNGLKIESIFEVMETYAQLYFIYVMESSFIVSNYSIRTDNQLLDQGNFPMWATDFFPETTVEGGRHAHILDFDVLRLGRKVVENNPNTGSFEFGVVVISEVGKERGNVLDHKEIKKNNAETNQKNDLFNSWLKMCRHSATVDHYPFVKVFTDEQRPESWGADARDLCDIVHIASSGKQRLAMPFYTIEEMVCETVFDWFIDLYYGLRYKRGDNTLLVHVLKSITAWLYKRNTLVYNRYGYAVTQIEKERGTMDGKVEKKKYYVMNKKIYANRFTTDCFSDYFSDMAKRSKRGLGDYLEYQAEKATVEELKMQNSYFINALYKNASSD